MDHYPDGLYRRVGEEVPTQFGSGQFSTHWRHFGCLKPQQVSKIGVNTPGFHALK